MKSIFRIFYMSAIAIGLATSVSGNANAGLIDDFESGTFSSNWSSIGSGWAVNPTPGDGAGGSDGHASSIFDGRALGAFFDDGAPVADFFVDLDFRIQDVSDAANPADVRQLSLQVSSIPFGPIVTGQPTINLRYQDGGFAVFLPGAGNGWQPLGLGAVAADTWHDLRIDGTGWGTAAAEYVVTVNGTASTSQTFFQAGDPLTTGAYGFNLNADFGDNPGFDVDNVNATVVPEPSSLMMLGLVGIGMVSRRREVGKI